MAAPQTRWTLDPTRNEWYYFSRAENAYVYQSGRRIPGPTIAAVSNTASQTPRTLPTVTPTDNRSINTPHSSHGSYGMSDLQRQTQQVSITNSADYGYSTSGSRHNAHAGASSYGTHGISTSTVGGITGSVTGQNIQTEPRGEITDPRLIAHGLAAKGKIRGTYGDPQRLYPEYQVRRPGKKFFKRGKVFKVLWPEILGKPNDSITVTSDGKFGEGIATKIRWFIVVMEGKDCCTCLPINTYGGKGVSKRGVVKWHHAIAYSSRDEPAPRDDELPNVREQGTMMVGVRIKSRRKKDKLDPMSRIDFARMYTVEHNVKVYDFGEVHKDSMDRLVSQWLMVIEAGVGSNPILPQMPEADENDDSSSDGENDNDDEDDEDDDDDQPTPAARPAQDYTVSRPTIGRTADTSGTGKGRQTQGRRYGL